MSAVRSLLLLAALVGPAHAEGGRIVMDCAIVERCAGDGACVPDGGRAAFELAPLAVGPDGAGRFGIRHDGISAEARNLTGEGPLVWTEGQGVTQMLTATGKATVRWQSRSADGTTVVRLLDCGAGR